jgi:carboxymethylenebutenolidase
MAEKFKALIRDYRDGKITRRQFMRRVVAITGSLVVANSLLDQLAQPNAHGAEVDPTDPAVLAHDVDFPGKAGAVFGYLARPSAPGKYPALIIIHANQGLKIIPGTWRAASPSKDTSPLPSIISRAMAEPKKPTPKAKG